MQLAPVRMALLQAFCSSKQQQQRQRSWDLQQCSMGSTSVSSASSAAAAVVCVGATAVRRHAGVASITSTAGSSTATVAPATVAPAGAMCAVLHAAPNAKKNNGAQSPAVHDTCAGWCCLCLVPQAAANANNNNVLWRAVPDTLRGLPCFVPQAAANAKNNNGAQKSKLVVAECFADQGPILKRFRCRAQGRCGHSVCCYVLLACHAWYRLQAHNHVCCC